MKLTKRVIEAATYQGENNSKDVRWDGEVKGFGLRIFPSGRKAFVLSYRVNGRKRLMTLGAFSTLTVDQARKLARAELVKVETGGADPLEDRRKIARGETVQDLCKAYRERHAIHKKTGKSDERMIELHILPVWGTMKIAAITRSDVAALHRRIGAKAPIQANRVVALLSKMFNLGVVWGFLPDNHPLPTRKIGRFKETHRDRWIHPEEMPRLIQAIKHEPNDTARHALWLYLLTGARKSELLKAKWQDVDFDRKELRLPDTKAGNNHYVPLSEPALAVLDAIIRVEGNPYILTGKKPKAHIVNISKAWDRVRTAAGIPDVRLHDLRRTVGSWLAQGGNSLHLIGRVLNHSNASTTQIYARFSNDPVRQALEQHGQRILGAAGLTPSADVIPLDNAATNKKSNG